MSSKDQLLAALLLIIILAGVGYIAYVIIKVREMNHEPVKLPEHEKNT